MTDTNSRLGEITMVGAAGFLGRSVVTALKQSTRPHVAFTRNNPVVTGNKLSSDAGDVDAIVWLASSINPSVAESNPELVAQDLRVLKTTLAAIQAGPVGTRFVLVRSGGSVYGEKRKPPSQESDPAQPVSAYGKAKLAMEQLVLDSLPNATVLRIANAYGPVSRSPRAKASLRTGCARSDGASQSDSSATRALHEIMSTPATWLKG